MFFDSLSAYDNDRLTEAAPQRTAGASSSASGLETHGNPASATVADTTSLSSAAYMPGVTSTAQLRAALLRFLGTVLRRVNNAPGALQGFNAEGELRSIWLMIYQG